MSRVRGTLKNAPGKHRNKNYLNFNKISLTHISVTSANANPQVKVNVIISPCSFLSVHDDRFDVFIRLALTKSFLA